MLLICWQHQQKNNLSAGKEKELEVLGETLGAAQSSLKKNSDDHAAELSKCKIREEVRLYAKPGERYFYGRERDRERQRETEREREREREWYGVCFMCVCDTVCVCVCCTVSCVHVPCSMIHMPCQSFSRALLIGVMRMAYTYYRYCYQVVP